MPDGDIYHDELARRYQQTFRQVQQAHHSAEDLAYNAMRPFKKNLGVYGNDIVALLAREADRIERMFDPLFMSTVDWDAHLQSVHCEVRRLYSDVRGKNIASDAFDRYLNRVLSGRQIGNHRVALIKEYFIGVWTADWEAIAKLPRHKGDLSTHYSVIVPLIEEMRPHAEVFIEYFAEQAAKTHDVKNLRMPKDPKLHVPVTLGEKLGRVK